MPERNWRNSLLFLTLRDHSRISDEYLKKVGESRLVATNGRKQSHQFGGNCRFSCRPRALRTTQEFSKLPKIRSRTSESRHCQNQEPARRQRVANLLRFRIRLRSIQHHSRPQVYPSSKFSCSPDSGALIRWIVAILRLSICSLRPGA